MLKYLSIIILALSFIACQDESPDEQAQQQQQQEDPFQDQMEQQQQPAGDVDVSDEELETFADAVVNIQEVQMESQQEMQQVLREEGIDVETYNKIVQGLQMGQSADEIDVTDEEMDQYESASETIEERQAEVEEKVNNAVEEAGMTMDRFQEINQAVEQDPQLQQRIQSELQDRQMQQQGDPQQQDDGF